MEQSGDTQLPDVVLSKTLKGALMHVDQRLLETVGSAQVQGNDQAEAGAALEMHKGCTGEARLSAGGAVAATAAVGSRTLPWGVKYLVGKWADEPGCDIVPTHAVRQGAAVLKLVGHPHAETSLMCMFQQHGTNGTSPNSTGLPGRVLIAVGPEGGWWEEELDLLASYDFVQVGLGPRVLTTTTAVIALVSCVQQALACDKHQAA